MGEVGQRDGFRNRRPPATRLTVRYHSPLHLSRRNGAAISQNMTVSMLGKRIE